jgi:regulator of RNase E activity RraA
MAKTKPLSAAKLKPLTAFDTPTICNIIEVLAPERRGHGFTTEPLRCIYPELPPIVGYARTGTIRATTPSHLPAAETKALRLKWYEYVDAGPKPSIVLLQDLDGARAGFGSFWGEVNSHIHRGLGALGVITNGSIRDVPMNATGFQMLAGSVMPSHAWVHVVDVACPITVCGMAVADGDLVHADMHGAIVIPHALVPKIARTAQLLAKREAVIIGAAKKKGFNFAILRDAIAKSDEIH